MIAIGILAGRCGGPAVRLWPAASLGASAIGCGWGSPTRGQMICVEPRIVDSVIVLGALAAITINAPVGLGAALMALCGHRHGLAHGVEAPSNAGVGCPLGLALSTAALNGIGVVVAKTALLRRTPAALRISAAITAASGVGLAIGSGA